MDAQNQNWDDLRFFLAVARAGTLSGAARSLGVTHSTVFRRLGAFEERLGVRLFERLPDGYALTGAGEAMQETAIRIDEEIIALSRQVTGQDQRLSGLIRITAIDMLAIGLLPPHLASFHATQPGIELEVIVSDTPLDLTRREADIALRIGNTPPETLVGRRVGRLAFGVYTSTQRAAQRLDDDLAGNDWIGFGRSHGAIDNQLADWLPELRPIYRTNSISAAIAAANYAALVSGSSFSTDAIAEGKTDIFVNLDLKTLETHPGLARTIIGALLNAIYNRNGEVAARTLFLLDEVARLGYLRILETARDAGRKYGISLVLLFQSIGQMRETYGGRDATSKWFESASWVSFAAINDPETADYISRRCGNTTVEVDQLSRSSAMSGSSRTRSKQLAARPLILPDEVLRMRSDEQIVFTAGNAPLRCGRAIWFRREDMKSVTGQNRFHQEG